jgi:hypothetical protein
VGALIGLVHVHYEIRSRVCEKYGAMYDINHFCTQVDGQDFLVI